MRLNICQASSNMMVTNTKLAAPIDDFQLPKHKRKQVH